MPDRIDSSRRLGARLWVRSTARLALFAAILAILWVFGIILHEMGHGLTAMLFGGTIGAIYLYPGFEIYPHFAQTIYQPGYHYFGSITFGRPGGFEDWQDGWITLMGSGSTLLVSFAAHGLLWRLKPVRLPPRYTLIALSLFYLDMVSYTLTGPLGLPRAIVLGRSAVSPEPLDGAVRLGISPEVFILFNIAILVVLTYSLICIVQTEQTPPAGPEPVAP